MRICKTKEQKQKERFAPFIVRLSNMKMEAFNLGLIRTGHKLDDATTEVGWEVADII